MKNTKRHATSESTTQRPSAGRAQPSAPTRRTTRAPTESKAPTLATAARASRHSPPGESHPLPSTTRRTSAKKASASTTTKTKRPSGSHGLAPSSLVHDAVHRAFRAAVSGTTTHGDRSSDVTECEHLRGELVRAMADHQRQADEIVALRALARSLKEEVEALQAAQNAEGPSAQSSRRRQTLTGHEFFQLDAHVDALREENAQLRDRVETVEREKRELEEVLNREIPRCELLAVQARAELESTASQLRDEQQENDRLRSEIAYYKARSRSPVRARRQAASTKHQGAVGGTEDSFDKENNGARLNTRSSHEPLLPTALDESLRESLMSSAVSLSMSAASAFSTQLQDDVETLKSELRRLHRSIDASMMSAARSSCVRRSSEGRQRERVRVNREEKVEEPRENTP